MPLLQEIIQLTPPLPAEPGLVGKRLLLPIPQGIWGAPVQDSLW